MSTPKVTSPDLMRSGEVSAMFGVNSRTINRWRRQGKISFIVTPGGEHRYYADEVMALRNGSETRRQVTGGAA